MRKLHLKAKTGECDILIGESIASLPDYIGNSLAVIVTDKNVRKAHGGKFPKRVQVIEIGTGEESKTLATVHEIYKKLSDLGMERTGVIIGIGGGLVCDVAGFAAATYLRGVRLILVPTTLLACTDAAIGGKNGVNLDGYKNLIGTIRQPECVICDFELLKTLPRQEIASGFAEIIKHACIADATLFAYLEENLLQAMDLKKSVIEKVMHDSLAVKTAIVAKDESEKNERMKLNFGHTVGHSIENTLGIRHGEAVAIGMMIATRISQKRGLTTQKESNRLAELLEKAGLPSRLPDKSKANIGKIKDALSKDKKRKGAKIRMALLEGIGKARIEEVTISEIEGVLDDLC